VYDTNKDGSIDFKEYMIIVYEMVNGSPEERLNLMFPIFDTNNDGLVSYEEINPIGKDNTNIMKHKFTQCTTDIPIKPINQPINQYRPINRIGKSQKSQYRIGIGSADYKGLYRLIGFGSKMSLI